MIQLIMAAACGWVLLFPQVKENGSPDFGRPYADWMYMQAFDTARDCESEKGRVSNLSRQNLEKLTKDSKNRQLSDLERANVQMAMKAMAARCVSADLVGAK